MVIWKYKCVETRSNISENLVLDYILNWSKRDKETHIGLKGARKLYKKKNSVTEKFEVAATSKPDPAERRNH